MPETSSVSYVVVRVGRLDYAVRGVTRLLPAGGGAMDRDARAFSHATSSVLALKIELYVPVDDTDEQREHEPADGVAAEDDQGQKHEHNRERRVQRPRHRLHRRQVDHLVEGQARSDAQVLAHAVEHDDGVVIEKATEVSTAVTKSEST